MNGKPRLQRRARIETDDFPVDLAWSPDGGSVALLGGDGALSIIDVNGTAAPRVLGTHAGGGLALAWQQGGMQVASSGQDGELRLWHAREGSSRTLLRDPAWTEHIAFSGNGKWLAAATDRIVRIYDLQGTPLHELQGARGAITALAWRAKLPEIAAAFNGGLILHQLQAAPTAREYPWKGACLTACWNPDGRVLAAGLQDGTVHFWYIAAGTHSEMKGYGSKVALTCWSANGRYLATAADELIVLWNFGGRGPEGSTPLQLRAHTGRIAQLQYQPQGAHLASAGRDRRLLLWLPGQSESPVDADLLSEEVVLLRWSNDGRQLVAGDRDGALTFYTLQR